jgi:sugar O-acyltransferase (sialic acid O-acetyltransferase NeuD family)
MTEDLVIVGAGGSARNIVWMVDELNRVSPRWNLRGLLDDDRAKAGTMIGTAPVLGPVAAAADLTTARFVVGIAHYRRPLARLEVVTRMNLPRERYATLVHPSAIVSPDARLGAGTLVFQLVVILGGAVLGDHAFVSPFSLVSHDAVADDGATMASGAMLCGGARLGAGAYAGARCVVRDGVTVGAGAVAGIGSVVMRDVPDGATVFGNPARSIAAVHSSRGD